MNHNLAKAAILLSLTTLAVAARGDVLVDYSFDGIPASLTKITAPPTSTAANLSVTDINATASHASLLASGNNNIFLGRLLSTVDASVSGDRYFEFTVTPDHGYQLDLTGLSFDVARGGDSTPRGWALRSSLDGFAANIGTDTIPTVQPSFTSAAVSLGAAPYQDLTDGITFRVYGYMPTESTYIGLYFDNVNLQGNVSLVPEPGAYAAVAAAGLLAWAGWRRRTQA
jgi:hypothetical protein